MNGIRLIAWYGQRKDDLLLIISEVIESVVGPSHDVILLFLSALNIFSSALSLKNQKKN